MKVVILAGGYGTRISEESHLKPKPMIEIGGKPILWHIMQQYSYYGFNDFIICCGYKQYVIKEYFSNYFLHNSDITFDYTSGGSIQVHKKCMSPWRVSLIDTGIDTLTAGRLVKVKEYLQNEPFCLTYGDGVSNVNIKELVDFHKKHGKVATITAIQAENRFGVLKIGDDNEVTSFREKIQEDDKWINAGFMVLNPTVFDFIDNPNTMLEYEPMEQLAKQGELMCYKHFGFWKCMDTMRDKNFLEDLWRNNRADWKVWED